jgi:hypothetical protein
MERRLARIEETLTKLAASTESGAVTARKR